MTGLEIMGLVGSITSIIGIGISIYCYRHYYNKSINSYKKLCKKISKGTATNDDIVIVRLVLKDATYLEIMDLSNWVDKKKNKTELELKLLEWINHEIKTRIGK
jgi:hypothetical protein